MKPLQLLEDVHQDLDYAGDIVIHSTYRGTIFCEGTLTVKATGAIIGEIHTQRAHIFGCVKGFLEAKEHVIFTGGSHFEGTLDAGNLVSALNCTIIGEIRVTPKTKQLIQHTAKGKEL